MRGGGRQQILPAGSEDARLVGVELPLFEVKLRLIELLLVRVVLRNHNNNNNSNSNTSCDAACQLGAQTKHERTPTLSDFSPSDAESL